MGARTHGVWVIRRGSGWVGRWRDPVTRDRKEIVLERRGVLNAADRRDWKRRKSDELHDQRRMIQRYGPVERTTLADGIKGYVADCRARKLEESTIYTYKRALEALRDYLAGRRVELLERVSAADLIAFRRGLILECRRPRTTSHYLGAIKTALEWWRAGKLTPLINGDDVRAACKAIPGPPRELRVLRGPEAKTLLRAALTAPLHHERKGHRGPPPAYEEDREPFLACALLTGCRLGELEQLRWEWVDLEAAPGGEIRLPAAVTKTKRGRTIDLAVSPGLREILRALPRRGPYVFGSGDERQVRDIAKVAKLRLQPLATRWTWQHLRQTCGTWLTCAPGIFGAASAYRSARQLGHSVAVAERHYLDVLRGIPPEAKTLDAAMGIEEELGLIAERAKAAKARREEERAAGTQGAGGG